MMDFNYSTFCPAPWFHLRIDPNGYFVPCRWMKPVSSKTSHNIRGTSMREFLNSKEMQLLRMQVLSGSSVPECSGCYYEDRYNKISGRAKSLFFVNIFPSYKKSFSLTPYYNNFVESQTHNGVALTEIRDLQVDLGNVCNSGCIMCKPSSSSFLASDFKKLASRHPHFLLTYDAAPWVKDTNALNRFLQELTTLSELRYIHLLGGETLYIPELYQICEHLSTTSQAKNIVVGTTTNGTLFDDKFAQTIGKFKEFHLGISIEAGNRLNDYIRYPSTISEVLKNIQRFLEVREKLPTLHLTLRITPNLFSILCIDELFQFAIDNQVSVESCNILSWPPELKIELIPEDLRWQAIKKLERLIQKNGLTEDRTVLDIRNQTKVTQVLSNRIFEYKHFLENFARPENYDEVCVSTVNFLKAFESIRGNSILDYAPEFTDFLRKYGY